MEFTFGTDSEMFMQKKGMVVSSKEILPRGERFVSESGVVERDGFVVEFQPVASSSILQLTQNLRNLILGFHTKYSDFDYYSPHYFNVDLQKLSKEKDIESLQFGCKADFSVYSRKLMLPNRKPKATDTSLRTAGTHLHIGIPGWEAVIDENGFIIPKNGELKKKAISFLKWIDAFIGLKTVIYDASSNRRRIYGKAADFRFTEYGIEYRTLTNYISLHPFLFYNIFSMLKFLAENLWNIEIDTFKDGIVPQSSVIEIINSCDASRAKDHFQYFVNHIIPINDRPLFLVEFPFADMLYQKDIKIEKFWEDWK